MCRGRLFLGSVNRRWHDVGRSANGPARHGARVVARGRRHGLARRAHSQATVPANPIALVERQSTPGTLHRSTYLSSLTTTSIAPLYWPMGHRGATSASRGRSDRANDWPENELRSERISVRSVLAFAWGRHRCGSTLITYVLGVAANLAREARVGLLERVRSLDEEAREAVERVERDPRALNVLLESVVKRRRR